VRLADFSMGMASAGLLAASLALATAGWAIARPPVRSGIVLADMDRAVRSQDDLFDYANGHWLKSVAIPADRSSYGVQQLMIETAQARQREMAEAAGSSHDPDIRKVGALYASFMDQPRIDKAGLAPLAGELVRIDRIATARDLAEAIGRLDRIGMTVPISTYVAPDARDSGHYALWLSQNDLGLPGRDYYLGDDARFVGIRAKYGVHVATMLRLSGDAAADADAAAIVSLETAIARLQWAPVDRRDPKKTYNPKPPAGLAALAPDFDWSAYFGGSGMAVPALAIARQPDYLAGVARLVAERPLATWKAYLRYLLVSGTAPYLPKDFAAEDFAFNQGVVRGATAQPERWKQGCELVDRLLGEASGKLYAERYFAPRTKAKVDALVANLLAAYAQRIATLEWMAPATRTQALAKLSAMTVKIGYPARWRSYAALDIRADDLAGNVLRGQMFDYDRQHRRVGAPVDRAEWQMTVSTPDAYYSPQTNEIAFPAGILQPPLYDADADDA
jgi:putative endopeptidase